MTKHCCFNIQKHPYESIVQSQYNLASVFLWMTWLDSRFIPLAIFDALLKYLWYLSLVVVLLVA